MKVTVEYTAQIRRAAGVSVEDYSVGEGCTADALLRQIADRHGNDLGRFLVTESGQPQSTLLAFISDSQIRWGEDTPLSDGQTVTLLSPISGG
jgi:molybdopterin converting factor small subunit